MGNTWPHIKKWMPIALNDKWENTKREFVNSYDILQTYGNEDMIESFLRHFFEIYYKELNAWTNIFDNRN